MERLQYIIEDRTISKLLGSNNFTTDDSAILELVKNAYDANATHLYIEFQKDKIIITDDGIGMNEADIKNHWMHIGKSAKGYFVTDKRNQNRVLAGSKGVGRFALARLGDAAEVYTRKENFVGVVWKTDWEQCSMELNVDIHSVGTRIIISALREKWRRKKIENLMSFLSKMYNDDSMDITVVSDEFLSKENSNPERAVRRYFPKPEVGVNCLAKITLQYNSENQCLVTEVFSDEFDDEAKQYCKKNDIKHFGAEINMVSEFKHSRVDEFDEDTLKKYLYKLGDFNGVLCFAFKPLKAHVEKFLYKHLELPTTIPAGVLLYRNAFGITSFDGERDWLEFGKRVRKSPAVATHTTGAWRVRENQIFGKIEIDKDRNKYLEDLANRQGLDENIYYELFTDIIRIAIGEFERYRQNIIRCINVKNKEDSPKPTTILDRIIANPTAVGKLSTEEKKQLVTELKDSKQAYTDAKKEVKDVEQKYKYDIRLLNVLSTIGLKATSIAHEMENDRNTISDNTQSIIEALIDYGMWDELNSPEKTKNHYNNIPYLLERNNTISSKVVSFMDVMLSETEKRKFKPAEKNILEIVNNIKKNWEQDYHQLTIELFVENDIMFLISDDIIQVILDNLILNSVQQNKENSNLKVCIHINENNGFLMFNYTDNGNGLSDKYQNDPRKILEVHETTRTNGHGLGMWIVNNTCVMSGGKITDINGESGFEIHFQIGRVI